MNISRAVGFLLLPLSIFAQIFAQDEPAPALFKSRVELVTVPVVVRDGRGRMVATLEKQNFQLFDRGKLQEIQRFSVVKAGGAAPATATAAGGARDVEAPAAK